MLGTFFLDNSLENRNVLSRSRSARHSPVDDGQGGDFSANVWIIEASEPEAIDDLTVPLLSPELLEEQKYDQFRTFVLATKASGPCAEFYNAARDSCSADTHGYLDYSRLPYHIVSKVEYVPWLTTTSWQSTLEI